MARWLRNVPLPEPHLIGFGVGLIAGLIHGWTFPAPPWLRLAGLCVAAAGLALAAWAMVVSAGTYLADPDRLVFGGPYAASRNPMYVGWTAAYVGIAIALANIWLVLLLPAVLAFTHFAVRREEKMLQIRFGEGYRVYATRVRRYL
jgi:protein-S-isoprenylcysteine O-methyltransferase Ste14